MSESPFVFGDEIEPRGGDLRVAVPPRIASREAFLATLSDQPRFPDAGSEV